MGTGILKEVEELSLLFFTVLLSVPGSIEQEPILREMNVNAGSRFIL